MAKADLPAAILLILVALLRLAGTVLAANGLDFPRQLIGGGGNGLSAGFWGGNAQYRVYLSPVVRNAP